MVEILCPQCNNLSNIVFGVTGNNLQDMSINFTCVQCGCPGTLIVEFTDVDNHKVEWYDLNYIG